VGSGCEQRAKQCCKQCAQQFVLRRAAEAHDPVGALALATTYDPNVLAELGVRGVSGDPAIARSWYEKAKEYGSREAPRRLELLASQGR
jgi:hypothetical protein